MFIAYCIIHMGSTGEAPMLQSETSSRINLFDIPAQNIVRPLAMLLLQMIIVIVASRFVGSLAVVMKQPRVIGEMASGILLGPSLFGFYFPQTFVGIFPKESLGTLQLVSQLGLILFMFLVGMELEFKSLKARAHAAIVVSYSSTIIPFLVGMLLALLLSGTFLPPGAHFTGFALFFGISMSVTAFPVLARILKERDLMKDPIGAIALSSAAVGDVSAWCLLAFVLAISQASSVLGLLFIFLYLAMYLAIMIWLVQPALSRASYGRFGTTALYLMVLLISSLATELIGVHALFGAFFAGLIMPTENSIRNALTTKLEDVSVILFLPLFFALTGLRTELGLLSSPNLWSVSIIVIVAAVAGKLGGAALAGRMSGLGWHQAIQVGILMNTRGLMELVVLDIGLSAGLLSKELYTILVIMALVTTLMTGPLLDFSRRSRRHAGESV